MKLSDYKGGIVSFEIHLDKDEILYAKPVAVTSNGTGDYNTDVAISFDKNFKEENYLASASYIPDLAIKNTVAPVMNNRKTYNAVINRSSNNSDKNILEISRINKIKTNDDLNRVRFIKDCISGGSGSGAYSWAELKALVNGENVAKGFTPTLSTDVKSTNPLKYMTDGNVHTYTRSVATTGEVCAVIDLKKTYNLDSIQIVHDFNSRIYGNKTYVSLDNKEYKLVSYLDDYESIDGVIIDAYADKNIQKVGNVYATVKTLGGAKWLRVLHHDTLGGTLYWDAKAQILTDGGYDSMHKQSILYNLEKYKNNSGKFEFLLEYSDMNGYNRWIQTSNPVTTTEDVTGYAGVKISWENANWYGLAASNLANTLLDGNKGGNWFYAVGVIKAHQGGVPAGNSTVSKGATDLWVRIDNLK